MVNLYVYQVDKSSFVFFLKVYKNYLKKEKMQKILEL